MAGTSWLVDKSRFASKIKSASGTSDPGNVNWTSNPSRACPKCQHTINNDSETQDWPGLPRGVKFDPSDQEIIWHLLAKVGFENMEPHPFIDEFIPTVVEDDGICYTHPQKLPGVRQDGTASHFFHRAIKAYSTGTRKRRKIHGDDLGDVRWHKTGRTKPVIMDGVQRGCKKIMVLYVNPTKGGKAEKTSWVMHQYHLGTTEDERDGEYVISKVFYQQQQLKQNEKTVEDIPELVDDVVMKVDPVTPKCVTPNPPRTDRQSIFIPRKQSALSSMDDPAQEDYKMERAERVEQTEQVEQVKQDMNINKDEQEPETCIDQAGDHHHSDTEAGGEGQGWENMSQDILNSQQLVERLYLCDDLINSQPLNGEEIEENPHKEAKSSLSVYARLGPEELKKDLAECQNLASDPANIYLDTPPDFRLSQLEFGSQDSLTWGW